jgi:MFS family permease
MAWRCLLPSLPIVECPEFAPVGADAYNCQGQETGVRKSHGTSRRCRVYGQAPPKMLRRGGLLLMVTLGYIDQVNISVAGPPIAEEFGLSPGTLGQLFPALFWSYTLMLVPVRWLSDRYGTRVMISLAIVVWSIGAVATGVANRFSTMLGARLLLGAGETPVYSVGSLVAREWAPLKERGMFTGMLNAGALVGPAVGAVLAAYLVTALGWRPSFYILGGSGFVLAAIWFLTIKRPERASWLTSKERDYIRNAPGEADEEPVEVVSMSLPVRSCASPLCGACCSPRTAQSTRNTCS